MKILLSYSYYHFDPTKPLSKQVDRNSFSGIMARTLYKILSEFGDVTYTDAYRYKEQIGHNFDLLVGVASHFHDILKANNLNVKKSIYMAVNMHPLERNRIIRTAIKELALPEAAIHERDIVDPDPYMQTIEMADFILTVGGINNYNSYIKHGVQMSKIKTYNIGLIEAPKTSIPTTSKKNYLYLASEIGLRKGFDLLYEMMTNERVADRDFHLDIIGTPSNKYYEQKVAKLKSKLGSKLTVHGWISSSSDKYEKVLRSNDFLLFPSLEEGQAGTVIDAIARGLVPIVSLNSGLDFAPLGYLKTSGARRLSDNINLLLKTIELKTSELKELKSKTLEFYNEFHSGFEDNLRETINAAISGGLYPLVSVVLAIHNKAETIRELIEDLDRSIKEYPAVELHIIFDGCTDGSDEIVRDFYAHTEHAYEVTYEVTPNIFEVHSNNIGLKKSRGKYCVIVQDDNYIEDEGFLFEVVNFLDKDRKAVVLGGLGGVNFYPIGTKLSGKGQITMSDAEVYWRKDADTNPELKNRIFQADAAMRGPLTLRKSFLEEHGYLDELYAPIHNDDMDLCLRANALGYKVYCMFTKVENRMQSVSKAGNPQKSRFFAEMMLRNAKILYARWQPMANKDHYLWVNRTPVIDLRGEDSEEG